MSSDYTYSHFSATWGKQEANLWGFVGSFGLGCCQDSQDFSQECTLRATCAESSAGILAMAQRQQLRIYSLNFAHTHTHTPYFSSQLTVYNLSFRPIKREISVAKQTISATKKKHLDVAHWVTVYLWHGHPVYLAIYWWISFYLISFQAGQLLKSLYFHRTGQRTKVETQFPTLLLFAFDSPALAATPT